jgi:hypothetical protein
VAHHGEVALEVGQELVLDSTPGMGSIAKRSMPTTLPFGPTFLAAICDQPPGAAPRSTTRWPGLRMWYFSSISRSL